MPRSGFNEYPENWHQIAKAIKDAAGWACERCQEPHNPDAGYTLTVHHLDMDKSNNHPWNLAALCQRCHLTIQSKVVWHQGFLFEHSAWMKPHIEGYERFVDDEEIPSINP